MNDEMGTEMISTEMKEEKGSRVISFRSVEINVERSQIISNRIAGRLSRLSETSAERHIFRVPDKLRKGKEAYEPEILATGPYHHAKTNLKQMEKYKLNYLQDLLARRAESNVESYIRALILLEEKARKAYAEEIIYSKNDFVEMLLLDGCFIIEFLRKYRNPGLRNVDDPIFGMNLVLKVLRDLILFENQVPFFILVRLFDMTTVSSEENLIGLVTFCLSDLFPGYNPRVTNRSKIHIDSVESVDHILGLMYESWCSSFSDFLTDPTEPLPLEFIKCTTELHRAGIKFEKAEGCESWLDIKFKNGVIKCPPLVVGVVTESVFKNLIAYEEYKFDPRSNWKCITDYVVFMDSLIKSPNDVKRLRHHQIIENWLGGDERVCAMFENLGKNVIFHSTKFCYSRVFKDVNSRTKQQWNVWIAQWNMWIANLRRTYFKTPWSVISFMAAVALLLLTCIQTIFAILQSRNVNKSD